MSVQKFAYIDYLRGIAILAVIAVHSHQTIAGIFAFLAASFNYGQLGVQLFFVVSAITLCLSMTARDASEGPRSFYIRRFLRIAPLYYIAILFYFLWRPLHVFLSNGSLKLNPNYNFKSITENIFFVHGFDPTNFNYVVPGGWSISVEMTFYLIFPALFLLKKTVSRKSFYVFSAVAIAAIGLIQAALIYLLLPEWTGKFVSNEGFDFFYASFGNQLPVFLIGMIAFDFLNQRISGMWLILVLVLIGIAAVLQNHSGLSFGMNGFFYPILSASAFGIIAVALSTVQMPNWFILKGLRQIGIYSFSMYICHFFVLDLVRLAFSRAGFYSLINPNALAFVIWVTTTALTCCVAHFTYSFIERPAISIGARMLSRRAPSIG